MSLLIERRELLDRFKRGERRALEEVYRHYAPEVAAFLQRGFTFNSAGRALRFSGYAQPFDLDNALQETFVRAFKESARVAYDGLHPYKSYLLAIARNLVLDEFRNREVAMSPFIDALDSGAAHEPQSARRRRGGAVVVAVGRAVGGRLRRAGVPAPRARPALCSLRGKIGRPRIVPSSAIGSRSSRRRSRRARASGLSHMQARTLEKKLRRAFLEFMQTNGYLEAYATTATVKAT